MTEEKINKLAKEYAPKYFGDKFFPNNAGTNAANRQKQIAFRHGYYVAQESMQKEIDDLKDKLAKIPEDQQNRVSIAVAEAEEEFEAKFKDAENSVILSQAKEIDSLKSIIKMREGEVDEIHYLKNSENNYLAEIDRLKEDLTVESNCRKSFEKAFEKLKNENENENLKEETGQRNNYYEEKLQSDLRIISANHEQWVKDQAEIESLKGKLHQAENLISSLKNTLYGD